MCSKGCCRTRQYACSRWHRPILNVKQTHLQLSQAKASSSSCSSVVLDRRASDDRSQLVYGSRSNGCRFGETVGATAGFATGLFEVNLDSSLPVLVEVAIWDDIVVFDRLVCVLVTCAGSMRDGC